MPAHVPGGPMPSQAPGGLQHQAASSEAPAAAGANKALAAVYQTDVATTPVKAAPVPASELSRPECIQQGMVTPLRQVQDLNFSTWPPQALAYCMPERLDFAALHGKMDLQSQIFMFAALPLQPVFTPAHETLHKLLPFWWRPTQSLRLGCHRRFLQLAVFRRQRTRRRRRQRWRCCATRTTSTRPRSCAFPRLLGWALLPAASRDLMSSSSGASLTTRSHHFRSGQSKILHQTLRRASHSEKSD